MVQKVISDGNGVGVRVGRAGIMATRFSTLLDSVIRLTVGEIPQSKGGEKHAAVDPTEGEGFIWSNVFTPYPHPHIFPAQFF